jgi:hypothetical protein
MQPCVQQIETITKFRFGVRDSITSYALQRAGFGADLPGFP